MTVWVSARLAHNRVAAKETGRSKYLEESIDSPR